MNEPEQKKHILIVDDEPLNITILTEILEEHFHLTQVEDGQRAIDEVNNNPPDLILLDIVMPGMNGLEVCQALKNNKTVSHIPVIFLSALDQISDKVAGYNAGADDYIAKPFSGIEVLIKIKLVLDKQQKQDKEKPQADNNMQMAMALPSQTDETDHVFHFLKRSFLTKTVEELCQLILETCTSSGVKAVVRANTKPPLFFSHDAPIKQIDQQILDMLHVREQLIDFENTSLVNFAHISLLIKNMPVEDAEKNGHLKDHITGIMEAANRRMVGLKNEAKLAIREKELSNILHATREMLDEIETDFNNNAHWNSQIMSDLCKKIEWRFVPLGLSNEQKIELTEIIENAIDKSVSQYHAGLNLKEKQLKITNKLNNIIKNKPLD